MEKMQKEMKLVINFKKVRDTILSHKTLLLKVWIVTFVLSCILILPQPRYYITEVSLVPEAVNTKAVEQLGSMASSFGVNLGSTSSDAIYPRLYPDLFASTAFLVSILDIEVTTLKGDVMTQEEREQMETMLRTAQRNSGNDSIDVKKLITMTTFPVAIELDKALANPGSDDDPFLREGDRIVVPRYTSTVTINGEVLYPNTVRYKAGEKADYYLDLAGGVSSTGKRSQTIIYMNGMVAKADRKHRPAPGCQIVVPTKSRKRGLGLTEWLSIGTSTASIATMIATIANLIK